MDNKDFIKEITFGNHIQIKRGDGPPQAAKDSFKVGELGYDLTNNDLYIRAESDMVRIGSNIVDTATANSQDLITSHGVSVIKEQVSNDISNLQQEIGSLKNTIVDLLFPVGTVITNASSTFNPNELYPGTTWERIKGRVIVGVDESDTSFNQTNKTGGHKELQSHTHNGSTNTTGNHSHGGDTDSRRHKHDVQVRKNRYIDSSTQNHGLSDRARASFAGDIGILGYGVDGDCYTDSNSHTHTVSIDSAGSHSHSLTIDSSGGGNAGNLQPYITKYVWERTA